MTPNMYRTTNGEPTTGMAPDDRPNTLHGDGEVIGNAGGPDWDFLFTADFEEKLQSHWSQMVWRAFGEFILPDSKILEVGCGSGKIIVQAARDRGSAAFGIDVSRPGIAYAQALTDFAGVSSTLAIASGFTLPFEAESFDAVLSEGVIEHFSTSQTSQMVAEHARVCRTGGRVLISVPNLLNVPLTYHKLRTGPEYHAYPERSYTVWGLAELMRIHGLHPIAYSGFAPAIGLEWFIHRSLRWRRLDRLAPNWFLALLGYETLVVAEKRAKQRVHHA